MIDIKLIRENRELVKENIKKKFQDEKLGLVDEVYEYDKSYRECKMKVDELRAKRNSLSASIGVLMRDKKLDEVEKICHTARMRKTTTAKTANVGGIPPKSVTTPPTGSHETHRHVHHETDQRLLC